MVYLFFRILLPYSEQGRVKEAAYIIIVIHTQTSAATAKADTLIGSVRCTYTYIFWLFGESISKFEGYLLEGMKNQPLLYIE